MQYSIMRPLVRIINIVLVNMKYLIPILFYNIYANHLFYFYFLMLCMKQLLNCLNYILIRAVLYKIYNYVKIGKYNIKLYMLMLFYHTFINEQINYSVVKQFGCFYMLYHLTQTVNNPHNFKSYLSNHFFLDLQRTTRAFKFITLI